MERYSAAMEGIAREGESAEWHAVGRGKGRTLVTEGERERGERDMGERKRDGKKAC